LVEESTNCTTPPVDDKADKSSTEDPRAQALVAQLGSKVPNDAPIDDDLGLLNFTMMVSWVVGWMSFLPQKYWPDPRNSDGPVWETGWSGFQDP
jgi:hypothetical protein